MPGTSAANAHALSLYEQIPRGVVIARRACYNCNHAQNVIVFPCLIDQEGQLALCNRCIKRAAKLLGFVEATAIKETLQETSSNLLKANETIEQQGIIIESYERLLAAKAKVKNEALPDDQPIPGLEEVKA